jgi:tRNA modification GTPase
MITPNISVIAALATPPGEGALAIVRLSGDGALEVADRVFRGADALASLPGYTARHGHVVNSAGRVVDEVVALVFRAPRSYTGEEMVEFSCHGGMLVTREVLGSLIDAGARPAAPGEFTRRAFMNGKMDLSQAEAVADLISAQSERGRMHSLEQLEGKLGRRVGELRGALVDLCALLELELDFSEEGIDLVEKRDIRRRLAAVDAALEEMSGTYRLGRIEREGLLVVLAGRPNVGKSSLFNALLGQARAIVTPVPGTTRDTIEESIMIDGLLFRLVDTAGLRRATDPVEAEGVDRTRHQVRYADIVILVEDASGSGEEEEIADALRGLRSSQRLIVVFNKTDVVPLEQIGVRKPVDADMTVIGTSAISGKGIDQLRRSLAESATGQGEGSSGGIVLISKRHLDAMTRAREDLRFAADAADREEPNEFIAVDVRGAMACLGEITGEVTTEEILESIFSKFCIGK